MLKLELKEFLSILIYCSLYLSSRHKDFWNIDIKNLIHIGLTNVISRDYFVQLEASFHASDPDIQGDVFSKLEPVNIILLDTYKAF